MTPEIANAIFGLLGGLIGAGATWLSTRALTERRMITIRYGEFEDLLAPFKANKLQLDLRLGDRTLSRLYKQTAWISNDGNKPLDNLNLPFGINFGSELFKAIAQGSNEIGGPKIEIEGIDLDFAGAGVIVKIDFLNVRERVKVDFIVDDIWQNKISCAYRAIGITVREKYGEDQKRRLLELLDAVLPSPIGGIVEAIVAIFGKRNI